MAIKMDGHTITSLQLKASDGSEVTKQLTEEGTIPTPTGMKQITANGTYDVTDKASAVVNVPAPEINLQQKTATTNGDVVADEGYDGLSKVIVNVSGDVPTLITKSISANGTYNASADSADGYSSVTVNVPAPEVNLQDKTVTANGTVTADEGYDGLGEVVVNVSGGGGIDAPARTTSRIITVETTIGGNTGGARNAVDALQLTDMEMAYLLDTPTAEAQICRVAMNTMNTGEFIRWRAGAMQRASATSNDVAGGIVAGTRYLVLTWA